MTAESIRRNPIARLGLIAGPGLALLTYALLPSHYHGNAEVLVQFSSAGRATLALLTWMAVWWITEAVDLAATAMLPIALLPLLGAASLKDAAIPYSSDVVFLFMGGFVLALSMQRWGLDKRIALIILRLVGTRPVNLVGAIMLATALVGGFVSNTAKAAMMLPIGLSVIALVRDRSRDVGDDDRAHVHFAACIVLGIVYASSISGVATLIGTPPNAFLAGFLRDQIEQPYRGEISFMQWMLIGIPLVVVLLPIAWVLLTRLLFPIRMKLLDGGEELIARAYAELGPMNRGEWATFIVFLLTAMAWVCRQVLMKIQIGDAENSLRPLAGLTDAGIGILGALILFVIPAGRRLGRGFVMDWPAAARLPWGILLLLGGGLSLAAAIETNGVAQFLGSHAHRLVHLPTIAVLVVVVAGVVLFSEFASNTATATTLIPILAAIAPAMGIHPYLLLFPATVAASFAFMMPVGTPPNAMALATGLVTMPQMIRAGLCLNVIAIAVITAWTYWMIKPLMVG